MIDNLYNPDSMSKEDIKTLFVARQPLLDELVSTVKNQPQGAGVQHVLIIAPRGMGKTTMLLMLQFAIEDSQELSKEWQPIRFPEESYGITELADFWLKVLHYLADATKDKTLETKIAEIEKRFPKSEDLREAAWATVKDWSKTNKKRVALMVDNFDMILSQINNDTEQARLRDILMNDGTVMLVGCAPSYFREIQDYGQPLYNFFKVSNLSDLKFADIEELLRRRAEVDEIENIEELLQENRTRIKALEAFTGGNPRLVLMLYRIITSSNMTDVRKGLERLLDTVTPFYKDKTEKLPPQQRKIINEIAQCSLEKSEGISPTDIAKRVRMTPNQVSTQLKRLSDNGYVKSLNIRGRSSFYALSEPLYAIWAQMRFGRNAREKRNWLVQILKALYDVQEIQKEIEKLGERVKRFKLDGHENKARGTLEYLVCLIETDKSLVQKNFQLMMESYLELKEISSIRSELEAERIGNLTIEVLEKLLREGIINEKVLIATKSIKLLKDSERLFNESVDLQEANNNLFALRQLEEAKLLLEKIVEINSDEDAVSMKLSGALFTIYTLKGDILSNSNKIEEAVDSYDKAIEIFRTSEEVNNDNNALFLAHVYTRKGILLDCLWQLDESIHQYQKAVNIFNKLNKETKLEIFFLEDAIKAYLTKISSLILLRKFDDAKEELINLLNLSKPSEERIVKDAILKLLAELAGHGFFRQVREFIIKAELEKELLPLVVAISYLETKDETLIEKLSPEVRIVVEETVRTLQMA